MKIISWNVNGIRACLNKGFIDFIYSNDPDIVCIQETKANEDQVDLNLPEYKQYWNSAERKGYSGTLILSKENIENINYGIGVDKHDKEGRVITAELENAYLVNVYVPNSGSDRKNPLSRLSYRTEEWDVDFLNYLNILSKNKPVIACGDFNVAHNEIDLANPKSNKGNAGFTDEERKALIDLWNLDFVMFSVKKIKITLITHGGVIWGMPMQTILDGG